MQATRRHPGGRDRRHGGERARGGGGEGTGRAWASLTGRRVARNASARVAASIATVWLPYASCSAAWASAVMEPSQSMRQATARPRGRFGVTPLRRALLRASASSAPSQSASAKEWSRATSRSTCSGPALASARATLDQHSPQCGCWFQADAASPERVPAAACSKGTYNQFVR